MRPSLYTILAAALLLATKLQAIPQPHPLGDDPEKAEAPTFQVIGQDANLESFPLKSTQVRTTISGVVADVVVEQTYTNEGKSPLEALYIFPASTRAAVHGVEMRIGERVVKATIQRKEAAAATYAKAKSEQKTASLLEQRRPNVFQMHVANIHPGDEVKVVLHYSEKLSPTDRQYEFVFPTVVGPRYSNKASPSGAASMNPYLAEGTPTPSTFGITVDIQAGMPLYSLHSPSHEPEISFRGKEQAYVTLPAGAESGDRDFILRYQLADKQVASGLILHEGKDENFFLLNLQPPARVLPEMVARREYLFVVDVSGSMHGFPLDTCKKLMADLLHGMQPTDSFNLLFFAGSHRVLSETPLPATPTQVRSALKAIEDVSSHGGTELIPALKHAINMPRTEGVTRSVVIVSDGFVDVEKEAFELVRNNLNQTSFFAFGIGTSVNRWLIEGLAHAGSGEPFIVTTPKECAAVADRFKTYISAPILTDVEVHVEGFASSEIQPALIPAVFADRPVEIIGKWSGTPTGRIIVRGKSAGVPYQASFDVAEAARGGMTNPALRSLWARDRIRTAGEARNLRGETSAATEEITPLGLKYELLTEYTSFVAVDDIQRPLLTESKTVHQPLPLPQGVTNKAVAQGGVVVTPGVAPQGASVPEPGAVSILLLGALTLMWFRHRKSSKA